VYNYYGSEPRIASPTQAHSEVKAPTAIATGNGARLWRAARLGQLPLVRRLLKLGADVRYRCNEHGTTALHQAAKNAHKNVVEALLEAGAEVDDEDNEGSIALHVATSADVVEAMVMAGADVDHEDRAGRTPGRRACERSDMSVVQVLLDGHADPSKIPYTVENGGDGGPASQDLQLIDQATLKQHDELDQTSPGLTARPIAPSTTHGPSTLDRSVTNPDRKVVIGIVSTISLHIFVTSTERSHSRRSRLVLKKYIFWNIISITTPTERYGKKMSRSVSQVRCACSEHEANSLDRAT
jgi:hypothetical protein